VPILRTLALRTDAIATLFYTAAFVGAPSFKGALAFNAAPAFGTDFMWEGAAFDEAAFYRAAFDKAAPVLFADIGAALNEAAPMPFGAVAF
jgi:hypothetical protein